MRKRQSAPESALLRRTRELLNQRDASLHHISMETGLSVNWLWRLKDGTSCDPGVNKVERVYVALTGKPLPVA